MATKKTNGNEQTAANKAETRASTRPKAMSPLSKNVAPRTETAALQQHVTARHEPSYDEIARRAYELFQQRGAQHGHHMDDWYRAELELRSRSN